MHDVFELAHSRPEADDLLGLNLPGLQRRARRRDRMRVTASTTLAIIVLGTAVVGIDRLLAPVNVPGVEIGPISPGLATDSAPAQDQEHDPSLQEMEAALRDRLMHLIALWDRTAEELVDRLRQAGEVAAEEDREDDPTAIEREVISSILVPANVDRLQRELLNVERALLRDRQKVAALDGAQPPGVLEDATWHGPSGDPISPQQLDVVRGSNHCDYQDILFLHLEWPLDSTTEPASSRQYVRDPAGTLADHVAQPLDVDATVPTWATPTSHHTPLAYLWLGPDQGQDAIYLVFPDHVERWPRADPPVVCF